MSHSAPKEVPEAVVVSALISKTLRFPQARNGRRGHPAARTPSIGGCCLCDCLPLVAFIQLRLRQGALRARVLPVRRVSQRAAHA
jgi:hypothetical protein